MVQFLFKTWAGSVVVITGWIFLLAAVGYGLVTDKISYTFIGSLMGALFTYFGVHFTWDKASKNGNGKPPNPAASA